MTAKEQQTIDNLFKIVQDLRLENQKFRDDVKLQVETINNKTEKKHLPVYLEQNILTAAQQAINESVTKALTAGYDSPMIKLVKSVIDENSVELRTLISDSFIQVIRKDDFTTHCLDFFNMDENVDDVVVIRSDGAKISRKNINEHSFKEIRKSHNIHKMLVSSFF